MKRAQVISKRGICNSGFLVGDMFQITDLLIVPENTTRVCRFAFASIVANCNRIKISNDSLCISCPDPATGAGGNVLFKITDEESK